MKPMLASPADLTRLTYPVAVSPKIDGVRCLMKDGVALSRSLKPIPNRFIQGWAARHRGLLHGLDGELVVGRVTAPDVFNRTQSGVMSIEGEPNFTYVAFDIWNAGESPYDMRVKTLRELPWWTEHRVDALLPDIVYNEAELLEYEAWAVSVGFEGIMIRSLTAPYKYGRSTVKEGYLLKLKRMQDAEGVVVDYKEMMYNGNLPVQDELGHTKRSSHQANLRPSGLLGALICTLPGCEDGSRTVSIGSGFSLEERKDLWNNRDSLRGRTVTYKYLDHGVMDKPRHPVFKGFRDVRDM